MAKVSVYEEPVCHLTKTGQENSYHANDDGALEIGIDHDFQVLTTGSQSGTTDIVISGKTLALSNNCVQDRAVLRNGKPIMWARSVPASIIGPAADGKLFWDQWTLAAESCIFNAAGKTITAAAGTPFDTGALCVGRKITISGTTNNNGVVTVAGITTSVVTTNEALTNEGPVDTSFATVDDLIWNFREQARTNGLGGFDDWEIPNYVELINLVNLGQHSPCIDTTFFPSTPLDYHWISNTRPDSTTYAFSIYFGYGAVGYKAKTTDKFYCRLVRS